MVKKSVAMTMLVGAALSLTACGGAKTTPFAMKLKNDLGKPASVFQCAGPIDKCLQTTQGIRIFAGSETIAPARANVPNLWLVQKQGEGQVSCLSPVFTEVPQTPPVVLLSSATPGLCKN